MMKRASCGLEVNFPNEICRVLHSASEHGFEFVSLSLVHPRFKREFTACWKDRKGPFTRPDLVLESSEWNSLIAGKISPYINVDCECQPVQAQARFALEQELSYGSHLDVPAIIITLKSSKFFNLARIINSNLSALKSYHIWVEVPIISHSDEASVWRSDKLLERPECTWEWWNNFKTICNSDKRLGVVLEIPKNLPEQKVLDRWLGEPIKCILISTSTFLTNKKGYPVLSRPIQAFVKSLVPLDVQVIIKGNSHHYTFGCYQKYIDHLWQEATVQQNSKLEDRFSKENLIQWTFQTLSGNLSTKNHETFEEDAVKYREYAKAIFQVLLDLVSDEDKNTKVLHMMVVGAGRGILVIAALNAAVKAERKIKVYAVEKNPHAIVSLLAYKEELWGDSVEIISADIRTLKFPQKIDIIVSELLGSFGDNQLSPELLQEAQKFLKKGGVSIPGSYTSYICPVQGTAEYSDLKMTKEKSDYEIPYFVMQKNKYYISSTKSLFSFHHPNYDEPIDNSRYKSLNFDVEQNCILHGFTGYFEATLYKNSKFSILPETRTPGLYDLHPLFFPLSEPVYLKAGDSVEVHFWRIVGKTSVWYEWTISKPIPLPIHNPNGRSSNMPTG